MPGAAPLTEGVTGEEEGRAATKSVVTAAAVTYPATSSALCLGISIHLVAVLGGTLLLQPLREVAGAKNSSQETAISKRCRFRQTRGSHVMSCQVALALRSSHHMLWL